MAFSLPSALGALSAVPLQSSGDGGGIGFTLILLFGLALWLIPAAGMWKAFEKADQPGWGSLVPILNVFYLLEIADKPTWWLILVFVPVINFFIAIVLFIDIAKNFGKGPGYGIGLTFLPFVFWPLLGFGDAQYHGDTTTGV